MTRSEIHIQLLLVLLVCVLSLIIGGSANSARADEGPDDLFNYSFAVWLGSGVYRVKDADKRYAVLRVPAAYTLRPADIEKQALIDRLGFSLLLPAVVGVEDETDTDFTFGAVAFVPGLEVQIPINRYWTLKPFAQLGAGKDTAGGDVQYIYGGGFRSLINIPWKKFVFGIGNSLVLAEDHDSTSNESSGFSLFNAGLDMKAMAAKYFPAVKIRSKVDITTGISASGIQREEFIDYLSNSTATTGTKKFPIKSVLVEAFTVATKDLAYSNDTVTIDQAELKAKGDRWTF